jgi:hypothetical protein
MNSETTDTNDRIVGHKIKKMDDTVFLVVSEYECTNAEKLTIKTSMEI